MDFGFHANDELNPLKFLHSRKVWWEMERPITKYLENQNLYYSLFTQNFLDSYFSWTQIKVESLEKQEILPTFLTTNVSIFTLSLWVMLMLYLSGFDSTSRGLPRRLQWISTPICSVVETVQPIDPLLPGFLTSPHVSSTKSKDNVFDTITDNWKWNCKLRQ